MATSDPFSVGQFLLLRGDGVYRVDGLRRFKEGVFVEATGIVAGMRVLMPIEQAKAVLRPLIPRAEAERFVAQLKEQSGKSDDRSYPERRHDVMLALDRRPIATQVSLLHALYRTPFAWGEPTTAPDNDDVGEERLLIVRLETPLASELSQVLERDQDALIEALRVGHPAFARNPRPHLPRAVSVAPKAPTAFAGHEYLGCFLAPSGQIAVGGPSATGEQLVTAEGLAGKWHAYFHPQPQADRSWEIHGELVLIHDQAVAQYERLRKQLKTLKTLQVHRGTMAMTATEVRNSEAFRDAAYFPVKPVIDFGATGGGCVIDAPDEENASIGGAKLDGNLALLTAKF